MEKLKLDVEDLAVQSFVTDDAGEERGTVHAHHHSYTYRGPSHCDCTQPGTDWETCADSCATCYEYTCWETCANTCITCYEDTCWQTCEAC